MTHSGKPLRRSRVPAGRLERLARFGWLAGEVAVGALAEGVRRVAGAPMHNIVLTATNAQRLAKRLSGLRGAAMKVGQMLSLQGEALLPPEIAQALAILRAEADAMPLPQLRRAMGQAYGVGWERRFREFDPAPLAAASIGQVHRARTDDGRLVALKIQYPGVARSIDSDVQNVATVLRLARLLPGEVDLSALLAEAKRQLRRETDYHVEAAFQERYRALVADDAAYVVPRVHEDFTTARILAMDFVDGVPLEDLCNRASQAQRDRLGALLYRLVFRELFEFRFIQSDPNFANYMLLPATEQLALLDFGGSRDIPAWLAAAYARLCAAGAAGDRTGLRGALEAVGFLGADESAAQVAALVELFLIGCEPFRHRGRYDFAGSTVPARARDAAVDLAFGKGFVRPPPPDAVFLQRKLAGTFLLCIQLHARVDVRALLLAALDRGASETAATHGATDTPAPR